jgi:hypothetical protein
VARERKIGLFSSYPLSMTIRRIRSGCCARAASGQAAAVPPSPAMNSRHASGPLYRQPIAAGTACLAFGANVFHFFLRRERRRSYSITLSALTSSASGKVIPRVFAVFRLMTSSTLVACCTGRSPGFSPLRIRPA